MLPRLPYLGSTYTRRTEVFKGIRRREGSAMDTCMDMDNIVPEEYPALKTARGSREIGVDYVPEGTKIDDFLLMDATIIAAGGKLYLNGAEVASVKPGKKQMASINRKLAIWPDKILVDLDQGTAEPIIKTNSYAFRFQTVTRNGVNGEKFIFTAGVQASGSYDPSSLYGEAEPMVYTWSERPKPDRNGNWDTGTGTFKELNSLRQGEYILLNAYGQEGQYRPFLMVEGETTFRQPVSGIYGIVKSIGKNADGNVNGVTWDQYEYKSMEEPEVYRAGDQVEITFRQTEGAEIREYQAEGQIRINDGVTMELEMGAWERLLEIAELPNLEASMTIRTKAPELDYIVACNNRIWGVNNGERTVYASALGKPDSWYNYAGTDADSYAVAVAGEGNFTGMAAYSGDVICFKADRVIRFQGENPSAVYSTEYTMDGLPAGAYRATAVINDVLYFAGRWSVYAWTPGSMNDIGYELGRKTAMMGQVMGTDGKNLFLSVVEEGEGKTYIYSTESGTWGEIRGRYERFDQGFMDGEKAGNEWEGQETYALEDGKIKELMAEETPPDMEWSMVFNRERFGSSRKKQPHRVRVEYELGTAAAAYLTVRTSDGKTRSLRLKADRESMSLILPQGRTQWIQTELRGEGDFILRAVEVDYSTGSDRRNR